MTANRHPDACRRRSPRRSAGSGSRATFRTVLCLVLLYPLSAALADEPRIRWPLDEVDAGNTLDTAGERRDALIGNHRSIAGVIDNAVLFDGYTTVLRRDADQVPDLRDGFAIDAWLAVAAYPWNRVPIVNQGDDEMRGFSFDLGPRGELILDIVADGRRISAVSDDYIVPHRRWAHVAASYDSSSGLAIYLDGQRVAATPLPQAGNEGGRNPTGRLEQAVELDLLVGAVREPIRAAAYHRYRGTRPSWYSLDGALDEVRIFARPMTARDIGSAARAISPARPDLAERRLPSGPPGPGRFAAYQTTLSYYPEWDALSRVGEHADVVVRFDRSPARVVFWRGTQYSPAWVTGNGLWMADQSVEGYDDDYTWEHMNDKHNRYSNVRVIENHDARVVVHWRYAPVNVENELFASRDRSELGAWIDEYYYLYPDVTGVRKVRFDTALLEDLPVQFQESIPLAHPGQTQGEVVQPVYATVGNLAGETQVLEYVDDPARSEKIFPGDLTIQMHHLRSPQQPFIVFEPGNHMSYLRDLDRRSLARPGSSSHWPVGRIWSDGRTAQANDRATSFLGFPISEPPLHDEPGGRSYICSLYGMTELPFDRLLELARSWAAAPSMQADGDDFSVVGFDRSERIYRIDRVGDGSTLEITIEASAASPLVNIPMVIQDWGDADALLTIDNVEVPRGGEFRFAHRHGLDTTDLLVWIAHETKNTMRLILRAAESTH